MFEEKDVTTLPNVEQTSNPLDDTQEVTPNQEVTDNTEQKPGETDSEFKLRVKYNKEEKELTREEAIELAQKGLNYDKVLAERDSLKDSKALKLVERLAQAQGMTVDEFTDSVEKEKELKALKEEFGITDKQKLEKLYQETQDAKVTRKTREEEARKKELEEQSKKDTDDFLDFYQERYGKKLDIDDIPKMVFDLTAQGLSLREAYAMHRLDELEKQDKIDKLNQENANSSTGPIGEGTPEVNEFTEERVANMSAREMKKHYTNPKFRKVAGLPPLNTK